MQKFKLSLKPCMHADWQCKLTHGLLLPALQIQQDLSSQKEERQKLSVKEVASLKSLQ